MWNQLADLVDGILNSLLFLSWERDCELPRRGCDDSSTMVAPLSATCELTRDMIGPCSDGFVSAGSASSSNFRCVFREIELDQGFTSLTSELWLHNACH
jgi:hypothetical protein